MRSQFTLEYWKDGRWYVGRLLEVPGVFSQGKTMKELQINIQDAYEMMVVQDRPKVQKRRRVPWVLGLVVFSLLFLLVMLQAYVFKSMVVR